MIKWYRNTKLIILAVIFILCGLYAIKAYTDLLLNNQYSRSLTAKSLKLQKDKVYLFSTTLVSSSSADTIVIPIENKSFPDSLCYLFYGNEEWKLNLSNNIRNDNKETITNPLLPWCCTQEPNPFFFSQSSTINEHHLLNTGVKFNYYSGSPADRLAIRLCKEDGNYFLSSNLQFLENTYPISKTDKNLIEVNFCNNTDTINNKFVFSFPFLGKGKKPERFLLKIIKDSIFLSNSQANEKKIINQSAFEINDIQFTIKENYKSQTRLALLSLYLFIIAVSLYNLYRLYLFYNTLPHRNLIVKEQANILTLRLLFNCIILLGFPLLIIQLKTTPHRINVICFLVLCLNINWLWLYSSTRLKNIINSIIEFLKGFSKRILSIFRISGSDFILLIILFISVLIYFKGNQEKLFTVPVLHITKVLYVLLPFTLSSVIVKWIENNKLVKKLNILKLNIAYLLIILLSAIILAVSKDFATPIFTLLALLLITILQKGNLRFIWDNAKKYRTPIVLSLLGSIIIFYSLKESIFSWFQSKVYRFASTLFMPDNDFFISVSEQSKQTVAQQIYLLKTSLSSFNLIPNFNQPILPTFKTTFFSDYAVLWSYKIGSYPFLAIYFSILVYLSYCIFSLLIILNKKIPLHNGRMVSYNSKMVLVFNVLLSLFLVQYIYTFLSNLWLLPLTGQSPGVLCPSVFELIFHTALINSLYFFIDKRSIIEDMPTNEPTPYTKVKKRALLPIGALLAISLVLLGFQMNRIVRANDEMKWHIFNGVSGYKQANQDSLEHYARIAFKDENVLNFKALHNQFYNQNNWKKAPYKVTLSYINFHTNYDSLIANHRQFVSTKDNDFYTYNKTINAAQRNYNNTVNNPFYSGSSLKSTTVNYSLQKELNIALQKWANKINTVGNYQMFGGCIIVAKNNGEITTSASYPLLFNENIYHLHHVEDSIRKNFDFKFKYHTANDYVNFGEYDAMPGSIVKPLLAYCGLKVLPENNPDINSKSLNRLIGNSNPEIAYNILKELSRYDIDTLKTLYQKEFSIIQFYDLDNINVHTKDEKTLTSYAIGQQNTLTFKNIVQAYTRIKTGKKIVYDYQSADTTKHEPLSLEPDKLKTLQTAMTFPLKDGTAYNVGQELRKRGIVDCKNFLAKTGTAQFYGKDINKNRTSSFIIVTNDYTIGIQLLGNLPQNKSENSARHLFIAIMDTLLEYEILHKKSK